MLFGNILGVTDSELRLIGLITLIVVMMLGLFHKELELTSVDPVYADVIGLRTGLVRYGLLVLLALATVAGIQAVGVVLTSALLITPAATASLLTNRLPRMMALSTLVAVASGVIGLYASYYANYSSGASIVLTATGFFLLAWFWRTVTGRTA
jgi:ABC-type Mn2+/Zn2+ transport system permease subunit